MNFNKDIANWRKVSADRPVGAMMVKRSDVNIFNTECSTALLVYPPIRFGEAKNDKELQCQVEIGCMMGSRADYVLLAGAGWIEGWDTFTVEMTVAEFKKHWQGD